MEMSEQINELAAALAKAQATMEGAAKDGLNPHFRSKYTTLTSIWDAARTSLAANGLSVAQPVEAAGDSVERVTVTTILMHNSGQWLKSSLTMNTGDGRPQSVGSAISYARRYQLASMVGVAPDDDDAEAAEGRVPQKSSAKRPIAEKFEAFADLTSKAVAASTQPSHRPAEPVISKTLATALGKAAAEVGWKDEELKQWLSDKAGVTSVADIPASRYDALKRQILSAAF